MSSKLKTVKIIKPRKLTHANAADFFATAKVGEVCTWAWTVMAWREVQKMALDAGVMIEYADVALRQQHGTASFVVMSVGEQDGA